MPGAQQAFGRCRWTGPRRGVTRGCSQLEAPESSSRVSGPDLALFLPRFIQGSAAQSPYTFYHWQYIDIFVYFSHHLVTVPPVGWTNAAHRHGVRVLGKS